MPFTPSALCASVGKFLSAPALEIFCKAASDGEAAGLLHNDCIRQGWAATKQAGWTAPETGKKWILVKDDPSSGDVHVDAPLGSGGKKKKPKPGDEFEYGYAASAKVCKVDESLGLVFGYAIVCKEDGEDYFDVQGDHIPEDAMLKASADFMEHSRVAKDMHVGDEAGSVVFCFPLTSEIAKAMGIDAPNTGLMIAMKPPADIIGKFKSGEYTGFSIGGLRGLDEEVEA